MVFLFSYLQFNEVANIIIPSNNLIKFTKGLPHKTMCKLSAFGVGSIKVLNPYSDYKLIFNVKA